MSQDVTTLDTVSVAKWLRGRVPGVREIKSATKFPGGQSNPTFRLDTDGPQLVLRRKPPGKLLKSAHAVDREFRVQKALAGSDVPVSRMYALCEDPGVIGSDFYVMDYVAGRNFNLPTLPEQSKGERWAIINEMGRVLAAIHDVDIDAVGLSDYGPEGNYYRRQIDRWTKQYRNSQTDDIAEMEALITWLDANIPPEDGQRGLVHGDFRIDNMLFHSAEPRCLAVLDWELSTIGHPYADLAAVLMQWSMPAGTEGRGLAGIDRADHGLPTDAQFVEDYCARRGISGIDNLGFYVAFTFFRMAGILQGVKKRALDGNASNPERALRVGRYVPRYATGGLNAAGQL
ncbi:phosphotransferase family protein [Shimia biformata]|uniref:phosphotransferase family protein n=1 Tax=Shimia biformata TaxID=1294299 RepID=UPI00195047AD|nr:phosphotransferase family protein [Shimia biformata]